MTQPLTPDFCRLAAGRRFRARVPVVTVHVTVNTWALARFVACRLRLGEVEVVGRVGRFRWKTERTLLLAKADETGANP